MCENNSSRACSKEVGVDGLRGSERFLAMQGHSSLVLKARGHGSAAPQCNRGGRAVKGPAAGIGGGYNQTSGGGAGQATHRRGGGRMSDEKDEGYRPGRAQRPGAEGGDPTQRHPAR